MGSYDGRPYDAIILAGGNARRFGGIDKLRLRIDGRTLLDRAIFAVSGARTIVVVGPMRPITDQLGVPAIRWTREQPPGTGPLAGIAAGLTLCDAPTVVVLAGDMPLVTAEVVSQLVASCQTSDHGAAVLTDASGRPQPLAGAYDTDVLGQALENIGDPRNRPVRLLLDLTEPTSVPDPWAATDCDTPDEFAVLNRRLSSTPAHSESSPESPETTGR